MAELPAVDESFTPAALERGRLLFAAQCDFFAGAMTVPQLADAIRELAATARDGRTPPSSLSGGTITITNIGVFGVDAGTPIIVPGEAAILAMGAVRRTPWEFEGGIALRDVMTLSVSFDHRMVDGEQGSRFLTDIGGILHDPASVLALV